MSHIFILKKQHTMPSIIILSISILTALLLAKLIYSSFTNKNKHPPSPFSIPIIGHLHLYEKPLHRALDRLIPRYGPIFSLQFGSRPVLVVSTLSLAEECFTKNDVVFANRVQFPSSKERTYNFSTIASANYGPLWRNIRRIATVDVLSSHRLNLFGGIRAAEVHEMVRKLFSDHANFCGSNNKDYAKVNLKSVLFAFALNNMMRMIAGKLYGAGTSPEAHKFQESVEQYFANVGASNVEDFLPILRYINIKRMIKKPVKITNYRDIFLQALINEYRRLRKEQSIQEDKSMISDLISLQETDPEYYSDSVMKALFSSMLSAGTDTSSDSVEWAMALLLNNPEKIKKAQAEIDERVGNESLLHESDLDNLPYLQCIITETLRLYPAGPLLVPHESSEDCTVGGYDIPKGTMLFAHVYRIHRDPDTWKEPEKFEPERFEDSNGELEQKMLPFGMGRRRCPGEGLARKIVGLALGTLLQCYEWERVGDGLVDLTEGKGLTLPRADPLKARYRTRESMVEFLSSM